MREDIRDLIRSNNVCVMATVSEGKPHCSLMSYVTDNDGLEIYMITQKETKKYRNLKGNHSVSLLIDTRQIDSGNRIKALTVTGTFHDDIDENARNNIRTLLLKINPDLKDFIDDPASGIIAVHVRTLQLLDGVKECHFETVT